ncbi:hypothetical protein M8J76_017175 [Diaphorina citri]|nr:hypothetical protein M8J75_008707 [Diaphorina citri]KAI5714443.1 hypothetical protein M8J76_017175 [Diaphorina citri]
MTIHPTLVRAIDPTRTNLMGIPENNLATNHTPIMVILSPHTVILSPNTVILSPHMVILSPMVIMTHTIMTRVITTIRTTFITNVTPRMDNDFEKRLWFEFNTILSHLQ